MLPEVTYPSEHRDTSELVNLSIDLLKAVKSESGTEVFRTRLEDFRLETLEKRLSDDNLRMVFWLNIYNAWYQILAQEVKLERPGIFTYRRIRFKDFNLSLDDIEHGILRRYRSKFSLGYLPQFFPDPVIKALAVSRLDYRIHFALNCGAKSCPPIQIFEPALLNQQLDLSAERFLVLESQIDPTRSVVYTTRLMQWFYADFRGSRGQRKILSRYLKTDLNRFRIYYRDYDWTDQLMNFGIQ